MVVGLTPISFLNVFFLGCALSKHLEERFEKWQARRATSFLKLVHSDIIGPLPHLYMNKSGYVITFIDNFSRYTWVYFLKHKDDAFASLQDFKALVEK